LEATAFKVTLAGKPVKILAAYLFSFPPIDQSGSDRLFWWGFAGRNGRLPHLAADHETGKLLRDYADENFCLIFVPDTPTTNPYNPSATPDVLGIAVTKDLPFPVI
jgi:hypothetical protein